MVEGRSFPRLNARRFMMKKITGVMISTCTVDVTMPPMIGAAIGFMTSDPIPVLHMIGSSAANVTPTGK